MPRAHIYKTLQNGDGSFLLNASVRVLADGTSSAIPDALYTSETGGGSLPNPFVATNGKVEFWLDNPQRVQLGITPQGSSEFFVVADAEPNAIYVVTSSVARLNLGTPLPGNFLHVASDGSIDYVGSPMVKVTRSAVALTPAVNSTYVYTPVTAWRRGLTWRLYITSTSQTWSLRISSQPNGAGEIMFEATGIPVGQYHCSWPFVFENQEAPQAARMHIGVADLSASTTSTWTLDDLRGEVFVA